MVTQRTPPPSLIRQGLNHLFVYPSPVSFTYIWNFGSLAGICLIIQIITGIFLAMHYTPTVEGAYDSLQHIMRDVPYGWFMRNTHATGASIFFAVVYCHIGKNLYYKTYLSPNYAAWASGLILFILLMAIAFLGYILPWGQMSLWGATVITNLFSAIPVLGDSITAWLWGGSSVSGPTLHRFAALHYILPFVLLGLVFVHLALIHDAGSNHATFTQTRYLPFYPYFFLKDAYGFLLLSLVWIYFIFFDPSFLSNPDNLIPADPLVTPRHIVPEWYFLPFYAILRAIPNKLGGVIYMFAAILIYFFIPLFENLGFRYERYSIFNEWSANSPVRFQYFHKLRFWNLVFTFILLGWLGSKPAISPFVSMSLTFTCVYFFNLTFGNTLASWLDEQVLQNLLRRRSITQKRGLGCFKKTKWWHRWFIGFFIFILLFDLFKISKDVDKQQTIISKNEVLKMLAKDKEAKSVCKDVEKVFESVEFSSTSVHDKITKIFLDRENKHIVFVVGGIEYPLSYLSRKDPKRYTVDDPNGTGIPQKTIREDPRWFINWREWQNDPRHPRRMRKGGGWWRTARSLLEYDEEFDVWVASRIRFRKYPDDGTLGELIRTDFYNAPLVYLIFVFWVGVILKCLWMALTYIWYLL